MIDHKKIALIHIIKKELHFSDSEYRNILKEATGVRSAKDLDEEKFKKLMNSFVRSKHYRVNPFGLTLKQKLYIKHLSQEIAWSQEHLDKAVRDALERGLVRRRLLKTEPCSPEARRRLNQALTTTQREEEPAV